MDQRSMLFYAFVLLLYCYTPRFQSTLNAGPFAWDLNYVDADLFSLDCSGCDFPIEFRIVGRVIVYVYTGHMCPRI